MQNALQGRSCGTCGMVFGPIWKLIQVYRQLLAFSSSSDSFHFHNVLSLSSVFISFLGLFLFPVFFLFPISSKKTLQPRALSPKLRHKTTTKRPHERERERRTEQLTRNPSQTTATLLITTGHIQGQSHDVPGCTVVIWSTSGIPYLESTITQNTTIPLPQISPPYICFMSSTVQASVSQLYAIMLWTVLVYSVSFNFCHIN